MLLAQRRAGDEEPIVILMDFDGRKAGAMLIDEPVNGVYGIAQCFDENCEAYFVVMCSHPKEVCVAGGCSSEHSREIERFVRDHEHGKVVWEKKP